MNSSVDHACVCTLQPNSPNLHNQNNQVSDMLTKTFFSYAVKKPIDDQGCLMGLVQLGGAQILRMVRSIDGRRVLLLGRLLRDAYQESNH